MLSSTLAAFAAILSSLAATHGAVVQRNGGTTYPTLAGSSTTSSYPSTTPSSAPTTSMTTSIPGSLTTSSSVPATSSVILPSTTSAPPSKTSSMPVKPTQTAGTVSCDGVQEWQAAFAYTAGDRVIFNNQLYTAKQWTYNNSPAAHADQWTLDGTCTQPINNQANCQGVPAWQNNVAYTTGNHVTYQGSLWSAVQWTYANFPGDGSGSWQDLGVCAQ